MPPPPHVVSLTVPTKTAPAGSNPFEDDDDEEEEEEEEELASEQRTTVNHISVNKEEIKTLVNRRKHSAHPQPLQHLFFSFSPGFSEALLFLFIYSLLPL